MPSAPATTSRSRSARHARPVRVRLRLTLIRSASAANASSTAYHARPLVRLKLPIDGESIMTPVDSDFARLVFAAQINHDEMQPERADGEVKAAQPHRRQAENQAEKRAEHAAHGKRHPERRAELAE